MYGQVAIARLLSARFFIAAISQRHGSARPVWCAACPQDSSGGLGAWPPTSEVLCLYKRTLLANTENYLHLSLQWMFVITDFI